MKEKKLYLRISLVLGLLLTLISYSCKKSAELSIEPKILDLGRVISGQAKTATLFAKNVGNIDLIIDDVKGDCSCTDIKIGRKIVAPGDSTAINITYTAETISSSQTSFEKYIVFKSNSSETITEYAIIGTVVK